jgi:hypothetical protein
MKIDGTSRSNCNCVQFHSGVKIAVTSRNESRVVMLSSYGLEEPLSLRGNLLWDLRPPAADCMRLMFQALFTGRCNVSFC